MTTKTETLIDQVSGEEFLTILIKPFLAGSHCRNSLNTISFRGKGRADGLEWVLGRLTLFLFLLPGKERWVTPVFVPSCF